MENKCKCSLKHLLPHQRAFLLHMPYCPLAAYVQVNGKRRIIGTVNKIMENPDAKRPEKEVKNFTFYGGYPQVFTPLFR